MGPFSARSGGARRACDRGCDCARAHTSGVQKLEVGYHGRPELQAVGYATEAAAACRDFAREYTEARELVAIIRPDNRASERVAERSGCVARMMTTEARFRRGTS